MNSTTSVNIKQHVPLIILIFHALGVLIALPATIGDEGQRGGLTLYGLITGVGVGFCFFYYLVQRKLNLIVIHSRSKVLDFIMLSWLFLAVFGFVVGLINGNALNYIISDAYRYFFLPIIYFLVVFTIRSPKHIITIISLIAVFVTISQLRDLFIVLQAVANGVTRIKTVFWIQNLIGLIALATIYTLTKKLKYRTLIIVSFASVFFVGINKGFRTYLLAGFIALCVAIFMNRKKIAKQIPKLIIIIFVYVLPVIILTLFFNQNITQTLYRSLESFVERSVSTFEGSDQSADGRSVEIDAINGLIKEEPSILFFGKGLGSSFELPYYASAYKQELAEATDGKVHNVHNTFYALLFRCGVVGLLMLVFLFYYTTFKSYKVARDQGGITWFIFLSILSFVVSSPFWPFVPGDILFPIILGILSGYLRVVPIEYKRTTKIKRYKLTW